MNGWMKYAFLAVFVIVSITGHGSNKISRIPQIICKLQTIDRHHMSIIKPTTNSIGSIEVTDLASKLLKDKQNHFLLKTKYNASYIYEKILSKDDFLNNVTLTHIDFLDLELYVDAYENINYLNQDF